MILKKGMDRIDGFHSRDKAAILVDQTIQNVAQKLHKNIIIPNGEKVYCSDP